MWTYRQIDGELRHDGTFEGNGYSGTGPGRNNPDMESVANVGPIPKGLYTIGPAHDHPTLGPCVMNLEPYADTNTFGRDTFRMHGDNESHNASHGCIVAGPAIRKHEVAPSTDRVLEVI